MSISIISKSEHGQPPFSKDFSDGIDIAFKSGIAMDNLPETQKGAGEFGNNGKE
jgi:hypothetical protein